MPDAADSLIAVADYFGVNSNNQQHFCGVFLGAERNFCTLVRDVYTELNPIWRGIWFLAVKTRIKILLVLKVLYLL